MWKCISRVCPVNCRNFFIWYDDVEAGVKTRTFLAEEQLTSAPDKEME